MLFMKNWYGQNNPLPNLIAEFVSNDPQHIFVQTDGLDKKRDGFVEIFTFTAGNRLIE